ncbi:hypothetical protein K439DRAFT_1625217 [Ramaria rubella]|nr:hypothetical protein K439DRAFT_1625217 [Ramaria rubella]
MNSGPECDDTPAQGHSHQDVVGSDDEEEIQKLQTKVRYALKHWAKVFVNSIGKTVIHFSKDISRVETTGHAWKPTWPRNRNEAQTSRNTMGYQIRDPAPSL